MPALLGQAQMQRSDLLMLAIVTPGAWPVKTPSPCGWPQGDGILTKKGMLTSV
jgi:hypothetical protein